MDGFDLTKYQEDGEDKEKIRNIFGKIVSGRDGYDTVVEEKKKILKCKNCGWGFQGGEKFCPECGDKC